MAVNRQQVQFVYGIGDNLVQMPPNPIIADRDPGVHDIAQLGTLWVNRVSGTFFGLASVSAGVANWTSTPAAGATILASLQVTGAGGIVVDTGDIDVTLGDINVAAGNVDIAGNLAVAGTLTFTGDLDLSSGALIDLTSTLDAAPSILLHANGGVNESIELHSDQGTSVTSINIHSDVGGVTIASDFVSADALNLEASVGGIDWNSALQSNIDSAQAAADALRLIASNAAGGIDIDCGTGGIAIDSTGAFSIDGAAASNITTTGAGVDLTLSSVLGSVLVSSTEDAALAIRLHANGGTSETIQIRADQGTSVSSIDILSDVGGISLTAGLASADAINLAAAAGGVDIDGALQVNIASSQAAVADSIRIVASAADGGIDIDAGTGGIALDSTGALSLQAAAASDFSVSGAGVDLSLVSAAGRVIVNGEEAAANAITLVSAAGGIDVDAALQINIASSQNAADAVRIVASAGGIDIDAVGAAGEDIVITNTGGSVSLVATEAVADAIVLNASDAAGGIDLLTGGGEISISSAGNVTMVPGTDSAAGTAVTINARVGVATFTGLTTAAAATETLTITNSALGAGDGVFCTVSNRGTNDARMTLTRVNTQTAGSLVVQAINNGAAALNGDIVVTFWIIN